MKSLAKKWLFYLTERERTEFRPVSFRLCLRGSSISEDLVVLHFQIVKTVEKKTDKTPLRAGLSQLEESLFQIQKGEKKKGALMLAAANMQDHKE